MTTERKNKKSGLGDLIKSVFAAFIGVQSDKNRERDFQEGSPIKFIIAGIVFMILFIVSVATIVGVVLSQSGQ